MLVAAAAQRFCRERQAQAAAAAAVQAVLRMTLQTAFLAPQIRVAAVAVAQTSLQRQAQAALAL
jgi:hypothetical protein